jgi:cytoskeletal protein CcmA (bactofilin family)
MFSKAKPKSQQDEKPVRSLPPEITSSTSAPPPSSSKRSGVMRSAGVPSIISNDVAMRGNITSGGEVQFDGNLEGDIKAASLIIGDKASVRGEVVCESVIVRGRVEGGIRARSVSLASTAHILGDILHSSLQVESGAHFEGNCRHSDDPLSETASKDFRKARPASTASAPPRPVTTGHDEHHPPPRPAAANEGPSFLSQSRSPLR